MAATWKNVVCDIETNDLLEKLDTVHSLVLRDMETDSVFSCTNSAPGYNSIEEGLSLLSEADKIYGHNILDFDIPALRKLYPKWKYKGKPCDTLVVARFRWAHIKETDFELFRKGRLPGEMIGRHSLEAWGCRMGILKGSYGKREDAWKEWSPEMQQYCERDTLVNRELVLRIRRAGVPPQAVECEQELSLYLSQQERNGFPFDKAAAIDLSASLIKRRQDLSVVLINEFGNFLVRNGKSKIAKVNRRLTVNGVKHTGYVAGAEYQNLKEVQFNPGSRKHIAFRLMTQYGWKPTVFTEESNEPEISETTLSGINLPCAPQLLEYLKTAKHLGMMYESKKGKAWMQIMRNDSPWGGKLTGLFHIHGRINQSGAVTHRATHKDPNMSQVPTVEKSKAGVILLGLEGGWGFESRSLFRVPVARDGDEWLQLGADASGLELRCLAHFMGIYDGGEYAKILLEGDIHAVNQKAAGLDTRAQAKTFIYALLYGAGDAKLGSIVAPFASEEEQAAIGNRLRKQFFKNLPALKYLSDAVQQKTKKHGGPGYLIGLDKRRIYVRHDHAALNSLLQCAGALICKHWIVEYNRRMMIEFKTPHGGGWNHPWAAMSWSHDEIQNAVRKSIADRAAKIAVESIEAMTGKFNFRCPLTGEAKLGRNWAETH